MFFLVSRASDIWDEFARLPPTTTSFAAVAEAVNPAVDGFRSFTTPTGKSIRDTWPLPKAAAALTHMEENCEGCTKKPQFRFLTARGPAFGSLFA